MATKDYLTDNHTLETFIPEYLRNKTSSSIIKNLFDRHLTKDESTRFFGYVGKKQTDETDNTPFVFQNSSEREINNLHPLITGTVGVEEHVFSFNDVLNRCRNLGIDTNNFNEWGSTVSYNFAPPIDFDKFVNYKRYYWIAKSLTILPIIPGNESLNPEYVVIKRRSSSDVLKQNVDRVISGSGPTPSGLDGERVYFISSTPKYNGIYEITGTVASRSEDFNSASDIVNGAIINVKSDESVILVNPFVGTFDTTSITHTTKTKLVAISTDVPTISDWESANYWVHENDLPSNIRTKYTQAIRPILEFNSNIELVSNKIDGIRSTQRKQFLSQSPIFSHYHFNGSISETSGSIIKYKEDSNASIDTFLQRRLAREKNTDDYLFVHSLIEPETDSVLFFKEITLTGLTSASESLKSVWSSGQQINSFNVVNQKTFDSSVSNIDITLTQDSKESIDAIIFTADSHYSITFESKVLGNYAGPIIRTGTPEVTHNVIVTKDFELAPDGTDLSISNLPNLLADGYTEIMSPIYRGETVEIPGYFTITYSGNDTVTIEDSFIKKIYTSEVPRYVTINEDKNLIDFYRGEEYDDNLENQGFGKFGAWLTPKPLIQNIAHEYRREFAYGDLTGHFRSIISEQAGIEGQLNGANNYRNIETKNFGIGGLIKNYDVEYNYLISHLLQDDITPNTMLGFIENQYSQNLLSVKEYLLKNIGDLFLKNGSEQIVSRVSNSSFIEKLYEDYSDFYKGRSDLSIFNDSTMPIPNWTVTLPFLKIAPIVQPMLSFDEDYGYQTIIHHDGHISTFQQENYYFNKALVEAYNGFVDNSSTPSTSKPWVNGMMWFNPDTSELRVLNLLSNSTEPEFPVSGDFWLNGSDLYRYNGTDWLIHPNTIDAWNQVSISCIIDSLILTIENKIYNSVVSGSSLYTLPTVLEQEDYEPELVRFAAKYNLDTYAPEYDPKNAWTWNYKNIDFTVDPTLNGTARWEQLYKKYLGTRRPYLFPWRMTDISGTPYYSTGGFVLTTFVSTYKTEFQKSDSYSLYSLSNNRLETTVRVVADYPVDVTTGTNCPLKIDQVDLNAGDKILLTSQSNPNENGVYVVVGSGQWNTVPTSMTYNSTTIIDRSWIQVLSGYRYRGTIWVVDSSSLNTFAQYRYWKLSMWNVMDGYTGTKKMCMDIFKEQMLPPYLNSSFSPVSEIIDLSGTAGPGVQKIADHALLNVFPSNTAGQPGIHSPYEFGDYSPVELEWRKSIEFKTSLAVDQFRKSPLQFLKKTWGDVYATSSFFDSSTNNQFERFTVKKLSHTDIKLHGETLEDSDLIRSSIKINGLSVVSTDNTPYVFNLTVIDYQYNTDGFRDLPIFKVTDDVFLKTELDGIYLKATFINRDGSTFIGFNTILTTDNFLISEQGHGFRIGDEISFIVTNLGIDQNSIVLKQSSITRVNGLNQVYTHLMKYNNYDTENSFNNTFLREWNVKYGYRFDSIVKSDDVTIKSETYDIPNSLRTVHLKTNPRVSDFWIHSFRIQLVRAGKSKPAQRTFTTTSDGHNVTGINGIVPLDSYSNSHETYETGSDWVFRIENYNPRQPMIDIFTYDESGTYTTFNPLNVEKHGNWKRYNTVIGSETVYLPKIVEGLQNVINIIFGYLDKVESDGWRFNLGYEPNIDLEINRTITWQSEIEKFISYIYTSINEGEGHIINPFKTSVWFESDVGMVSKFETSKFVDFHSSQVVCDVYGNVLPVKDIKVLRNESLTEINTTVPMFSAHIFIDEYEHVVLFENYVDTTNKFTLIFDPYLGIFVSRLLFNGYQHPIRTGRPVLGGHYLNGQNMVQNVVGQIDQMSDYYDSTKVVNTPKIAKNSLALLGFNKKDYFDDIGISDQSQLNFWQALIQSKGTNQNIDAYLNNNLFKTAYLDEYWAYKVAEYGDARTEEYPDLNINSSDVENSYSIFKFHGLDDLNYTTTTNRIIHIDQLSDDRWSYTNRFDQQIINYFMKIKDNGQWTIDLEKLGRLSSENKIELQKVLNKHFYFSAKRIGVIKNLEHDTLVGSTTLGIEYRDPNEDQLSAANRIYTIKVPHDAVHADMAVINFYKTVNSREVLAGSNVIKNDNTPLFTWTDAEWTNLTLFEEVINRSGKEFTLNNLVYQNRYLNTSTSTFLDTFSVASSKLDADYRSSLTALDMVVTRINGKLLRFIPSNNISEFYINISGDIVTRIEIEFFAVDIEKNNGTKLLDYSKDTLVEDIPLWHPQIKSVSGIALRDIDYSSVYNPAKFNEVPNTYRNSLYSSSAPWGKEHVGTIWWDMSELEYSPYYDTKIYPLLQDRISRWGKVADYSGIKVYEWVESDVPPSFYDDLSDEEETDFSIDESIRTTGNVAQTRYVRSQRIWWSKSIAWSHPDQTSNFTGLQDTRMILSGLSGDIWVTVDNGSFDDYGIEEGISMVGWGNSGYQVEDEGKPFGQLTFTGLESSIIGRDISDEYFRQHIGDPGSYPITPLFTSIKNRSSEMNTVYSGLTGVAASDFKKKWLIESAVVSKIDNSKTVKALSSIEFRVEGFIWDARFINKDALVTTTYSVTNRKGVNDDNLKLSLIDEDYTETINIQGSYLCSSSQPIVFKFPQSNIKITFNINPSFENPNTSGTFYSAHPVYDLFGGTHPINGGSLDPLITDLSNYTDRDGEFNKWDKYTGGVLQNDYDVGSVYVRKMISASVVDTFDSILLSNNLQTVGTEVYPEQSKGWRIFKQPTQKDLDNDAPSPFNLWVPIYGDVKQLSEETEVVIDDFGTTAKVYNTSQDIIDAGSESFTLSPIDKDGYSTSPYQISWSDFVEIKNSIFRKTIVTISEKSIDIDVTSISDPNIDDISVFINGQIQPNNFYSLDEEGILTFDNGGILNQGSEIVVVYSPSKPSEIDLEFDPLVNEDFNIQNWFRKDYNYTSVPVRDFNGGITSFKYYFWVENKTTKGKNKIQSLENIVSLLENKPITFMTLQDILPEVSTQFTLFEPIPEIDFDLPIRYQTVTVHGLDLFVERDDSFKIRFVNNFVLRNNPNELDLKNTHIEWALIRPGLSNRLIPFSLWTKFVDSVCGKSVDGTIIPSSERVEYDKRHFTKTRYGFNHDQTLCDSDILIESIKYIIQNTKILKISIDGETTQDFIDFLDFDKIDSYFSSPIKCRETLEAIWTQATKRQVNELFFACLEDIAALNYEMTDLFKTSRLSVYSLRTINEVQQTGIVYDN